MLEDAETVVIQTLGVKQGDVLGPELYLFHGIGLMMAWRARCGKDKCTYRTKFDDVLSGREWSRGGKSARDCLVFTVDDSPTLPRQACATGRTAGVGRFCQAHRCIRSAVRCARPKRGGAIAGLSVPSMPGVCCE